MLSLGQSPTTLSSLWGQTSSLQPSRAAQVWSQLLGGRGAGARGWGAWIWMVFPLFSNGFPMVFHLSRMKFMQMVQLSLWTGDLPNRGVTTGMDSSFQSQNLTLHIEEPSSLTCWTCLIINGVINGGWLPRRDFRRLVLIPWLSRRTASQNHQQISSCLNSIAKSVFWVQAQSA